jgi:hypothetical protein
MNTHTHWYQCALGFLTICIALLPSATVHATGPSPSLLYGEYKPAQLIGVVDPTVNVVGAAWWGAVETALFTAIPAATPVVALTAANSWIEATCATTASTVGVQFLGDQNDGWAKIFVDGEPWWQGTIQGNTMVNDDYIEIPDLPLESHVIRVETMVTPGTAQFGHVTVVAFGCGSLATAGATDASATPRRLSADEQSIPGQTIYLPTIML